MGFSPAIITMQRTLTIIAITILAATASLTTAAEERDCTAAEAVTDETAVAPAQIPDTVTALPLPAHPAASGDASGRVSLYALPYSRTLSRPNWKRLWINTGVLVGGAVATLAILESLPDDATAWSRAERRQVPFFRRWVNHVKAGPVWDHDKFVFNYVLHPYGGAAYYMSARSCGFNCWGSFLYGFAISTLFWEYGFEAFNEIPSVQDLVITPVVGAVMGECFYRAKRSIVSHGYELLGSPVLGYIAAFFLDPVNEVTGYFRKEQYRIHKNYEKLRRNSEPALSSGFWIHPGGSNPGAGVRLTYNF